MRSSRGVVGVAVIAVAVVLAACTGGSGASKPTGGSSTPLATTAPAPSTAVTSTTMPPTSATGGTATTTTATPTKTVPVDQIPPGRPTSWVPAGVPTTAKYKEPGDVVPRFTLDMFKNNYNGALAVMTYYFDAVNWDAATGFTPSIYPPICITACSQDIHNSASQHAVSRHLAGGRYTVTTPNLKLLNGRKESWSGQFHVRVAPAKLLDDRDRVVQTSKGTSFSLELDADWSGRRWTLANIYYVQ